MAYLCPNGSEYLPTGHADQHVLASEGADNYLMNFYITQNSSTYRPPRVRPKSNILGDKSLTTENLFTQKLKDDRKKTGFVNNERYYLPYTRSLDELDNPILGYNIEFKNVVIEKFSFILFLVACAQKTMEHPTKHIINLMNYLMAQNLCHQILLIKHQDFFVNVLYTFLIHLFLR